MLAVVESTDQQKQNNRLKRNENHNLFDSLESKSMNIYNHELKLLRKLVTGTQ